MLARFTVANFLSFNNHQSLSLVSGSELKNRNRLFAASNMSLLKFGAIFGANAAGKSNVIKAMAYAHRLILEGTSSITNANQYYRMAAENKEKPSYFEFEIAIDGKLYAYGFEVIIAQKCITEEWLYALAKEGDHPLFVRNSIEGTYHYEKSLVPESLQNRFEIYLSDMKSVHTSLFLHEIVTDKSALYATQSQLCLLPEIYRWFIRLTLTSPSSSLSGYSLVPSMQSQKIGKAITHFATGISAVRFKPITSEQVEQLLPATHAQQFSQDLRACSHNGGDYQLQIGSRLLLLSCKEKQSQFFEIVFEHEDQLFSYEEESDGVRRLFDLLSVLVTSEAGTVFLFDEIDRSLHPQMTLQFIRTYLELAQEHDIQLVITTHESHLLDLSLLRRDEIFFVEKARDGSSVIYPFDQFEQQFDGKLEQAYLNGRYGGVPLFGEPYLPMKEEL